MASYISKFRDLQNLADKKRKPLYTVDFENQQERVTYKSINQLCFKYKCQYFKGLQFGNAFFYGEIQYSNLTLGRKL